MSLAFLPYYPDLARVYLVQRNEQLTAEAIAAEAVLKDAHAAYVAAHDAYSKVAELA